MIWRAKKRYVGRQKFCRMMIVGLLMKSAGVCISIPVRNMAMQSSAKYFATMTGMLMEY
jgi:hypothetical protein